MTIISTVFELLGVSAIMPFVNVAMNPESIYDNELLSYFYELFHLQSVNQFLILLAVLLVCIYIFKNGFLILLMAFNTDLHTRARGYWRGSYCPVISIRIIPSTWNRIRQSCREIFSRT